jgi:hypothetical protein
VSLHRRAARRDANEPEIRAILARAGWLTVQLSITDWPDLLAVKGGRKELLEVKMPGEGPTPGQAGVIKALAERGVTVYLTVTGFDFLEAVGNVG